MHHIIISLVTYKNHTVTEACLASLEKIALTGIELTLLVINNDTSLAFNYSWKGKGSFEILNQKTNLGFSGGHNVSLRYALEKKADYVLVLNNDTIVDPEFLINLVKEAERQHEKGVMFGPKIYFAKGHEFHKERYTKADEGKVLWYAGGKIDWRNLLLTHRGVDEVDTGRFTTTEETDFVSGCCMLIRTTALKKVGVFDERYFLYLEDSDLNMRMKRAGFLLYFVSSAVIWHENAGSTGGSGSSLQDYFISRNRLLFGFTFAPLRTKLALVRESLILLRSGREWQKKGIRDFYLKRFGKGSYDL